jgi:hypothetical protein
VVLIVGLIFKSQERSLSEAYIFLRWGSLLIVWGVFSGEEDTFKEDG